MRLSTFKIAVLFIGFVLSMFVLNVLLAFWPIALTIGYALGLAFASVLIGWMTGYAAALHNHAPEKHDRFSRNMMMAGFLLFIAGIATTMSYFGIHSYMHGMGTALMTTFFWISGPILTLTGLANIGKSDR